MFPIGWLLLSNSLFILILIFFQNKTKNDFITNKNSNSSSSFFEKATWFCFFFQFLFLGVQEIIEGK